MSDAPLADPRTNVTAPQDAPAFLAVVTAVGLYVQVLDGIINLSNGGGSTNFSAGQLSFTPSFKQPPVVLLSNPGIQFTPPSAFPSSTATPAGNLNSAKSNNVDCEVR